MEKSREPNEIIAELISLVENLQGLADEVSLLDRQSSKLPFGIRTAKSSSGMPELQSAIECPCSAVSGPANIIPFPGTRFHINTGAESNNSRTKQFLSSAPFLAMPGNPLPSGVHDYRPVLQRDGLILLAWDKRNTETGDRYTAYWVTSAGIPRFYASGPLVQKDFAFARPYRKSYAAEDGIDFYGQEAPAYIVHVAPELMKSNPRHRELRSAHINLLKKLGSKVNFNHKYLLKLDKNRRAQQRKSGGHAG